MTKTANKETSEWISSVRVRGAHTIASHYTTNARHSFAQKKPQNPQMRKDEMQHPLLLLLFFVNQLINLGLCVLCLGYNTSWILIAEYDFMFAFYRYYYSARAKTKCIIYIMYKRLPANFNQIDTPNGITSDELPLFKIDQIYVRLFRKKIENKRKSK